MTQLVIILPVYEDVEAASLLLTDITKQFPENTRVVVVDDGSVKEPFHVDFLSNAGAEGELLALRRNVGHQRALAVGLSYVAKHYPEAICVLMDADGEDLPNTVPQLLQELGSPEVDVAVAHRRGRVENARFKAFYAIYKAFFYLMTGRRISFGNFMAIKPWAVRRISVMQELGMHIAGCVLNSKLRVSFVPIDRGPRYAGQSKMDFSGLVLHGLHGFMVFAESVLVRVGIACAFVAALSLMAILVSLFLKIYGMATPGWFSVALGILVLVLSQTAVLTLITLLLTGLTRSNAILSHDRLVLIDKVFRTPEKQSGR